MNQNDCNIFPVKDALEMVLIFDDMGKISYANDVAAQKLEFKDDLCGSMIADIFPNDFKITEDGFETEYSFGYEIQKLVAYRKNHTCFPVEVRMMRDSADSEMYICMFNDTLEKEYLSREIAEVTQEAQRAMKVKSEFVANVTHELRTPVNGVLGNVRELLAVEEDAGKLRPLRMIERCCEDMNKIINNILDFSKLEAGKFTLETQKFHFRNMLDHVKGNHINKITEKGLEFFVSVSPQVPEYIIGDELRIKQILNNLLSNALKFTAVGKVTVEVLKTAQVDDRIELFFLVIDSGIGIDKADRDKLFQSFSQVDASISRKYGGTGLGLNICKQLVELMGGRIDVESEKGKGSTFSFSIWVGACEEERNNPSQNDIVQMQMPEMMSASASFADGTSEYEDIKPFDRPDTRKALQRNLRKLILCVEMENWEKAETFMETVRQLADGAPREVSRAFLRLKMAVQKEDYDKVSAGYHELNELLQLKEVPE